MVSNMHRLVTAALVALVSLLGGDGAAAQDSVTLQPGIVLNLFVVGVPDFRYRVAVDAAGRRRIR